MVIEVTLFFCKSSKCRCCIRMQIRLLASADDRRERSKRPSCKEEPGVIASRCQAHYRNGIFPYLVHPLTACGVGA